MIEDNVPRVYTDSEGRECDLSTMCLREPGWAASRIRWSEQELERLAVRGGEKALRCDLDTAIDKIAPDDAERARRLLYVVFDDAKHLIVALETRLRAAEERAELAEGVMRSATHNASRRLGDSTSPGADLRLLTAERRALEAEQCAEWLAARAGLGSGCMKRCAARLAIVMEAEARKRSPNGVERADVVWYGYAAKALASTLRELAGSPDEE